MNKLELIETLRNEKLKQKLQVVDILSIFKFLHCIYGEK
jgi:hypothetical protein